MRKHLGKAVTRGLRVVSPTPSSRFGPFADLFSLPFRPSLNPLKIVLISTSFAETKKGGIRIMRFMSFCNFNLFIACNAFCKLWYPDSCVRHSISDRITGTKNKTTTTTLCTRESASGWGSGPRFRGQSRTGGRLSVLAARLASGTH